MKTWFTQVDAAFATHNVTDDNFKVKYLVTTAYTLDTEMVDKVMDVIKSNLDGGKYPKIGSDKSIFDTATFDVRRKDASRADFLKKGSKLFHFIEPTFLAV